MANQSTLQQAPAACRPLEWLNFFVADVQTGLGPFLAAYLAASAWSPRSVGYALTLGGIVTVLVQTPVGALVDSAEHKRAILLAVLAALCVAGFMLTVSTRPSSIYLAQVLIGLAGAAIPITIAAITLGIVGQDRFDIQFGRNQSFNSAGNVAAALCIGGMGYYFGVHWIFLAAILFAIPAAMALFWLDPASIDNVRARAADGNGITRSGIGLSQLLQSRVLLALFAASFLFHLSNAAMLPQLGEMLAHGDSRKAAPFMSACIIVTQCIISVSAAWIGRRASIIGRRPLLLTGFACLPVRGVLYALTRATPLLISIQALDGIANAIFSVVTVLVVKDITRGTGRFNLVAGALASFVGAGAALSPALGGEMIQRHGYTDSFLSLAGVGVIALVLLALFVPETLHTKQTNENALPYHVS